MSYGQQSVRLCGPPQRTDTSELGAKQSAPSSKLREWEFVPSLCVSERYDSNVTFSSGSNEDFVTHVAPKILVRHSGEYVAGTLDVSGFNETYVKNPTLNFLGGAGALTVSFDKTIKRFLPNASFGITESLRYTPLPPSFLNPIAGTSPNDPINPQDAFARGVIAFRTNTFTNNAGADFSYRVGPGTDLNLSYSNAMVRYLKSDLSQSVAGSLFDVTTHTGTVGASTSLTASDALNVRYTYSHNTFSAGTTATSGSTIQTGVDRSFQSHSALLGWSKKWSSSFTSDLRGGTVIINADTGSGLTSWAMNASLTFTDPSYPVTLSYSRSAFPSIFGEATPVIGNIVSLSATQWLSRDWQLAEMANFSQSTGGTSGNSNTLKFTTYRAGADLYYWMTRIWSVALSYDYLLFDSAFANSSGSINSFQINRHSITLGVKATWE